MNQAILPELLQELPIGTLNAVRFRIVPIKNSAIAEKSLETIFPLVHLKCLPQVMPVMDHAHLDMWSITPGSILDLLRLKKETIVEHFLPSCHTNEVMWKISMVEDHSIIQVTIVAGHSRAVLSV